jgi:hypothetical protein
MDDSVASLTATEQVHQVRLDPLQETAQPTLIDHGGPP